MSLIKFWLRKLASRSSQKAGRRQRKLFPESHKYTPLFLERLEDRLAPATDTWTGASLVSHNWSDPANWSTTNTGGIPVGGDDLVFPTLTANQNYASKNDLPAGTNFNSITLAGSGYVLSGNALTLNTATAVSGLANTGVNSILIGITLGANETFNDLAGGTLILGGPLAEGTNSLTVSGAGNTLFNSAAIISGSVPGGTTALTMSGTGVLTLQAANTYGGVTAINSGIVNIQNATALGKTGAGNETTITAGANLQFQGGITEAETILSFAAAAAGAATIENVSGNNTLSGTATLTGTSGSANLTVDAGTLTLSGAITDGGVGLGLNKGGAGTLVLSSATSNYGGATNINAGTLTDNAANALGGAAATPGQVNVASGASLQLNASTTYTAQPLSLTGAGFNGSGALFETTASNTWAGSTTLTGATTISAAATFTLTLSGVVSGSGAALTKTGAGNVALTNADTYSGPTTVNAGTLTLSGGGTAANSFTFTVNVGASLTLDDTGVNTSNRLGGNALILNGGAFTLLGNATTPTTETVGAVTLNTGTSTITSTSGTGNTLTFSNLVRKAGATAIFLAGVGGAALGSAANQILVSGAINTLAPASALVDGIFPWADINSAAGGAVTDVAAYGANGFINYSGYTTTLPTSGSFPTVNYELTNPSITLTGNLTVNSILVSASTASTIVLNGFTLTIGDPSASGALAAGALLDLAASTSTLTISGSGALTFSNEGIIVGGAAAVTTTTISSTVSETAPLTVTALNNTSPGGVVLSSTGNTASGVTLDQGTMTIASGSDLGAGPLTLVSGNLQASAPVTVYNPVVLIGSVTLGGATAADTLTFDGSTSLTSNSTITLASAPIVFNGVVSGANSLTLAGTTSLTLGNANTYSGGTILNSGTLNVGNNNALGTGSLTVNGTSSFGGTVGVTLPNAIAFNSATVSFLNVPAVPITFNGPTTLTGANTLTFTNTGGTTFAGTISGPAGNAAGGSLTLGGTGTVFLPGANTFSGGATVSMGVGSFVVAGNNASLGAGPLTLNANSTLLATTPLTNIANPLTLNGAVAVTGNNAITFSGLTTLGSATTLTVNNSTTVSGVVSGNFLLTVQGTGALTLSGGNINSGGVTLNNFTTGSSGVLAVTNGDSLGSGTITLTSGVLQNTGPGLVSFANAVSLGGVNPVLFAGNNTTFLGNATLTANAVLGVNNTTIFNGVISGGFGLTLYGTPVVTAGGVLMNGGALELTNANTYSGSTVINGGALAIGSILNTDLLTPAFQDGSILNSTAITVNNGGALTLDNTVNSNINRINDTATLTLDGGIFNFNGSAAAGAEAETLGQLILGGGESTVASNPGAGNTAALTFNGGGNPDVTRSPGATVNFAGAGLGTASNKITFASSTSDSLVVNGVIPFAYVNGADFATSSSGVISAFAGYVGMPTSGGTGVENVQLTANTTVRTNTNINSLKLVGNITLTILPGVTLTIGSGGVLITGATGAGAGITGGTLVFTSEAIIRTDAANGASSATIGSTLGAGTNAVTLTGGGALTLPNANSYSGTTTINGGLVGATFGGAVTLGNPSALGAGSLVVNGGALQTSLTGGLTLINSVTFSNSTISLGSNPMLFTGPVNLGAAGTNVTITNAALAAFDGVVSGAANLTKLGAGVLVLSGANTYTGATTVGAGTVQVQNSLALGASGAGQGTVVASGATVALLGSGFSSAEPFTLYGTGVGGNGALRNLDAGSGTSNTLTGTIFLAAPTTIDVDAGVTLAVSGVISGPGDLNKIGAGTLSLSVANTYTGNTTLGSATADGGFLAISVGKALGAVTGSVTVNNGPTSGATLQVSGAITVTGKTLILNGTGVGTYWAQPIGALENTANTNTWSGNVVLNPGTVINNIVAVALNISGVVSGSADLNVVNGPVTLTASNTFTGNVNVTAATLTLANTNAYAGATTIGGGAFNGSFQAGSLTLNGIGSALNSTSFAINQGGTLTLDNSVFNSTARISSSAPLTFNSGTFTFLANNTTGVSTTQTLGPVTLASGQSTINAGFAAAPVTGATSAVTITSLTRNVGAMANFIGGTANVSPLGATSNQLLVNSGLTSTNGAAGTFSTNGYQFFGTGLGGTVGNIIPFAEVNGPTVAPTTANGVGLNGDFATYTANGIAAFSNYVVQNISAAGALINNATSATDIVKVTATGSTAFTITAASNQTVGALFLANNATVAVTLASIGTLTVASGAIMTNGSNIANTVFGGAGTINLPVETCLFQNQSTSNGTASSTQFATALTGTGSLVIGGTGNYSWTSATGSTYTGGTVINSDKNAYITQNTGAFGSGPITLTGGALTANLASAVFSNPVNLNGSFTFTNNAANDLLTFTGPATLTSNAFITVTGTAVSSTTFQGSIGQSGGAHSLTLVGGTGTLILNNANTFTGGFVMAGGNLLLGNNSALGTGTLTLVGGTTGTNLGTLVLANPVQITNSTLTLATNNSNSQGNNITFAGQTTLFGSNTLNIPSEGLTTFQGAIVGSGALTLTPAVTGTPVAVGSNVGSMIELSGANTFSGGVTIGSGSLVLTNPSALGAGPLTLAPPSGQAPGPIVSGVGTTPLTFTNALNINGAVTFGGNTPLTFSGATTLLANTTVTMNGTATVTLNSVIGETGGSRSLAVAGNGALALPDAAYYSGGFTLSPFTGGGLLGSFSNITYGAGTLSNTDYNIAPVFQSLFSTLNIPNNAGGLTTISGVQATEAAAQFTGYINIINAGTYTFQTDSDDGSTLWIDGALVVNADQTQTIKAVNSSAIFLTAGLHSLRVLYQQGATAAAALQVAYSGPDNNFAALTTAGAATGAAAATIILAATSMTAPGLLAFSTPNVLLGNSSALGSGAATLLSGVLQASAALTISNAVNFGTGTAFSASPVAFAGSPITFTGNAALNSNTTTTLSVNNTTTFTGVVSGTPSATSTGIGLTLTSSPVVTAAGVSLTGGGNLVLTNSDTYTGATTVNAGTLTLSGSGALTASGIVQSAIQTLTFSAATGSGTFTLTFNGAITAPITYSSTTGALQTNIQNALNALSTIGVNNALVTAVSATTVTVQFQNALGAANLPNLIANGVGLTGATVTVATTTPAVGPLAVNQGGALTLDNTLTNSSTRLPATATIALNGGAFNFLGNAGAAASETFGNVTLGAGSSTISSTAGAGAGVNTLTFGTLTAAAGATINFQSLQTQAGGGTAAAALGTTNVVAFSNNPTNAGGIIPGATVTDNTSSVTVGGNARTSTGLNLAAVAGTGPYSVTPLTSYKTLSTTGGNASTDNVFVNASTGPVASDSVNAVLIQGAGVNISGSGATLAVNSGTIVATNGGAASANTLSVSTLALGTAEGKIITNDAAGATTISSNITGSNGLSVAGAGTLALTGSNNAYTAANTVQTLTIAGTPTTGAFTLTYNGAVTGTITAVQTSAAAFQTALQSALNALGTIGVTNNLPNALVTSVTGTAPNLTATITFQNALAGVTSPLIVTISTALAPVAASVTSAITTAGSFTTNLDGGTLLLASNTLANGGILATNGTIQTSGQVIIPNAVAFNSQNGGLTVTGASPVVLTGPVLLGSGANTVNVSNTGGVLASGVVSGGNGLGALVKAGTATLTLANANNFVDQTVVAAGILNVQNNTAIGATGTTVLSGAALQLQPAPGAAGVTLTTNLTLFGGSGPSGNGSIESLYGANGLGGLANLAGATSIGVDGGSLTQGLNGATPIGWIAGAGDLTKVGGGTLTLTGINTFTGQFTLANGITTIGTSAYVMGALFNPLTVQSGATLQTNGTFEPKTLNISGTGYVANNLAGALQATAATTLLGNIVLNPGATIGVSNGVTLTMLGALTGGGSLVKVGSGALVLQTNNTYSGNTYVDAGFLTLNNGGAIASSNVFVNPGATLTLDNNGGASTNLLNRLPSNVNLTLDAGIFNFIANAGVNGGATASSQSLGTITLAGGQSTINSGYTTSTPVAGSTSVLTVGNLIRSTGATVNFVGGTNNFTPLGQTTNGAANQIFLTQINGAAPSNSLVGNGGGILPWAEVNGGANTGDFATYGLSGLTAFVNYVIETVTTAFANLVANAGDIVKINATVATTIRASLNQSIGGLLINNTTGNATVTVIPTGALTLSTGALMTLGSGTATDVIGDGSTNSLNLGSEGVLFQNNSGSGNTNLYSVVTGSGSLDIAGTNTVSMPRANTYTGGTYVNAGTVMAGSNNSFGSSTSTLTLIGGTLQASPGAIVIPNPVAFNNSNLTISGANDITFTGGVALADTNTPAGALASTLTNSNSALTTFSGVIGGGGGLTLAGAGTLDLAAANTFTGGAYVTSGTVILGQGTSLGASSGVAALTGGALLADTSALTVPNPVILNGNVSFNAGSTSNGASAGSTLTFSGLTTLAANATLTVNNTTTFNNTISGPGVLTVAGLGDLALTGSNTYTGGTILNNLAAGGGSGVLSVNSGSALGAGQLTLTSGVLQATSAATLANSVAVGAGPTVFSGSALTFNGLVNLAAADTLLLNNATTINGYVTASAATTLTLSGAPIATAGSLLGPTGSLTLTAPSNLGANNLTLVVSGGTLTLSGAGSLNSGAATAVTVNLGGTLALSDTAAANLSNRINPAATLTLNGGTINFSGATGLASTQTLGNVTFASGNSTIESTAGTGGTAALAFGAFTRTPGATVNFEAGSGTLNTTSNQISFTANPTTSGNGIVPGAVVSDGTTNVTVGAGSANSNGFNLATAVTSGAAFTIVALGTNGTAYQTLSTTGGNAATDNVFVNTSAGPIVSDSLNAVLINGNGVNITGNTGAVLTVGVGGVASTGGTNNVSVPTLAFGSNEALAAINSGTATISSAITGSGGLTISGGGTLSLPNANAYTGTTSFNGGTVTAAASGSSYTETSTGTLLLGSTAALASGAGAVTLTNGTVNFNFPELNLTTNPPLSLANPLTLNSNISAITLTSASPIVLTGAVGMAGANNTLTVNYTGATVPPGTNVGGVNLTNIVAGAGNLVKLGASPLAISGANTYTGTITIGQGVVVAQASGALGTGKVIVTNGTSLQVQQINANGALTLGNSLTVVGAGAAGTTGAIDMLGGGTGANTIGTGGVTLLGDTTIGVDVGQLTVSSGIGGSAAGLIKAGAGMLSLSGTNTYTGTTNISTGILEANSAAALGAITSGTVVQSGATLDVGASITGETVTLNGAGVGTLPAGGVAGLLLPRGALLATANSTFSGNIIVNSASVVGANTGVTLNVNGIVSGAAANLTKVGAGTVQLNANDSYTGTLTVSAGALTLANVNANTGATTVTALASLTLNAFGSMLNSTSVAVAPGGTLTLDDQGNGAINVANRISTSANVTLTGATLNFTGNNTPFLVSSQTLGSLTLAGGGSIINITTGTGTDSAATLTAPLTRSAGATVNIVPANAQLGSAFSQVLFPTINGSAPSASLVGSSGGILPWGAVNGTDLATYGASGAAAYTNYVTSLAAAGPNDIVKLTANEILTTSKQIGGLVLSGGVTVAEAGFTLTVESGSVLNAGGTNIITGGVLAFGSQEGIVNSFTGTTTLNSVITGSGGLTIGGTAGALVLPNPNTYTGTTNFNGGSLLLGSGSALGPATNPLVLTGGSLQGIASVTIANPYTLNNANITFLNNSTSTVVFGVPVTFTGTGTVVGNSTVIASNQAGVYFDGQLTGSGQLIVAGTQPLFLTNSSANNNYSGGTVLAGAATVVVGDSNALGVGPVAFNGATLLANTAVSFTNPYFINAGTTFSGTTSATNITLSGTGTLTASATLTDNNLGTVALSGSLGEAGGPRTLTVNGLGILTLSGANTYSGGTSISTLTSGVGSGELNITNANSLGSGTLTLSGGVLQNTSGGLISLSNAVSLSGGPTALTGSALTFSAAATLSANTTLLVGNTTNIAGGINGNFTLTLPGTPIAVESSLVAATGNLVLNSQDTSTGAVTINGGALTLSGALGALSATTGLTVSTGGTLALSNTAANLNNRINTAATLTLNGGTINFSGAIGLASTQTLGNVTFASGNSTIQSTPGTGGTAALAFGAFARAAGATVNFEAGNGTLNTTSNQITFTANPTTGGNGIVPGAVVSDGTTTVTVGAGSANSTGFNRQV